MPEITAHPSREQLSAYNLGQLPPEEATTIESHISECEPCCDTIISLSSEDTFVGLLKEARELPTDQTTDHGVATAASPCQDIPVKLAEHPRYEVLGLIGKGGMGDVYKARHRKMERTVALKVINRGLVQKAEAIDRFHREVKAAAQLSHPNIVTSHDADHAGDFHFMVMEFIEGVDLSQTVKKRGALPVAEACDYIRQAAMGLQHAHERGMVHRDIKPHNMMVTQDRVVKILDFGLASLAPQATPSEPISEDADGNLTIAGAIMGTPDFISPEQARDARQVDGRSDIYSLGMTLYYLLAGRAPFGEGSAIEKLKKQAEAEPEPLSRFREDVPAELENIIHRMTAKNPAERFQSPQEVAVALKRFANELTKVSKPQPAPQKTQAAGGSIVRWIGAAILIAMLGAGGLLLLNPSDPEADYKSLDKFLATGVSDEPAGDIVRRLLRKEEGRQFLRKLDARHPTLAYTEGQFARGYTSVAAFAYENHITGVAQPELLVIGWGPTVSGMKTCNVVESFTLEAIDFDNAPDNTCLATLQFRTPQNEKRALGLKAQSLYEAEIPIQTLIEGSLSLSNEFKKGKFVRNAPKDSSEPTDPQIVSDSNSNHQTDMPGGPGEQGFDSVLQGDWEAVSVTDSGKQLSNEDGFGRVLLQLKDNTFVIMQRKLDGAKNDVDAGQIEINSSATPKTIDFIGRAERRFGIYEFKQGMLRVCLIEQAGGEGPRGERFPDGNPVKRPTTFESPAGSNIMLMEFTRSESAQEHDVSTIQGTWQVTYSEDSGRIAPQEMLRELRFVIDEHTLTTEIGGRKSVSTYRLDPSTNPKSIDLTENGRTKQAIYDLVGDTLRICIAESGEQRPTAFDSQPNSANDIVLILKRVKPDNASADGTQDQKHDGPLSEEQARSLIPTAASISNEDFQKLQTNPSATSIKNKSLSLALMTLDIRDQSPEAANDFRFLVEGYPKPSEVAAAMSPSRSKGYFSIIQPDYITECKITNSTDEIAQGKVTFNAPKLYIGSATFEARKQDGTWRIEKFHLPSRRISIVLDDDGYWQLEGKDPEGNQAPDTSDSAPDETPEEPQPFNDDQSLDPSNSQLDNVDLPRLAISPDITSLVWVDVRKVTTEKIQQSLASLLDAAPPEKREWASEVIAQCRRRARPGFTALEKGMEAGIEVLVMGEKTNRASAVAADVEDALEFVQNALTAIELGLDAEDFDAEVPEPVDSKTGQLFVRMRPDTNPEDAIAIMVETFMTEAQVTPGSEEAQALEQVKAMEFVEIGDSWFAVKGEKMLQPKDQALDNLEIECYENPSGYEIREFSITCRSREVERWKWSEKRQKSPGTNRFNAAISEDENPFF